MNGAEALVHTALRAGVEICFANPGTTEMPLVAALDTVPGIRPVLALHEAVCTGAADGWGRVRGRPALTLLHLGPGFANGISNLHNARRARTPVVNLVGEHASWHVDADPPLASDIAGLAAPVSRWVRTVASAKESAPGLAEALCEAASPPGGVATLILPADCQWGEADGAAAPVSPRPPGRVGAAGVQAAADALRRTPGAVLLLGGAALRAPALWDAARIAAATGCRLFCETFPAHIERGAGLPAVERFPYFPEQGRELLEGAGTLVLAGAIEPVGFFGYPDQPRRVTPEDCALHALARPEDDVAAALVELAEACGAHGDAPAAASETPAPPTGPLSAGAIGAAVAALQPEGAVVVDEAITSGLPYFVQSTGAARHALLALCGGSLGMGLPCATGAALAAPDRKVITLQADGSGMYTLQALWTQAREQLDVVNLVFANRSYRILRIELARAGIPEPGPQALALTDIGRPPLDWCALATGLGVPAERVETGEALCRALRVAFAEPGPRLIEMLCT